MIEQLKQLTAQFVQLVHNAALPDSAYVVTTTPKGQEGDYTIVTFGLSKPLKQSPEQVGQALAAYLRQNMPDVRDTEAIKGFLNVTLKESYWINRLKSLHTKTSIDELPPTGKTIMVEYCSPNTNKPLHLGHLRNIFLGYGVAEILKAAGNKVIKTSIINDRGVHICKSMLAYMDFGNGETPESSGIKGDHLVGKYYVLYDKTLKQQVTDGMANGLTEEEAKKEAPYAKKVQQMLLDWENNDPAVRTLWQMMNTWVLTGFEETYRKIGNDFDKNFYESQTYLSGKLIVEAGLRDNIFFKKDDGSVWIDLTNDGLDQKLVLRADGTSVYITQDIGTADLRYKEWHPDVMIYVVGNEQDYHFNVLQLICRKLDKPYAGGIYHLNYGMVDLPQGRMKSREGTVVDADDLIEEMEEEAAKITTALGKTDGLPEMELRELFHTLGMGALKYFILKVDPKKRMVFNPAESVDFHGNTGPFIQYTYARLQSLLRKFNAMYVEKPFEYSALHPFEHTLCASLTQYTGVITEAAQKYDPGLIANYIYNIAKQFNSIYAEVSFLNDTDENAVQFRYLLAAETARVIKSGLRLLGISAPNRM